MKTYTQQDLEEYARQKQMELLDEVIGCVEIFHTAGEGADNFYKMKDGILCVLDKKREQLTLDK